MVVESGAALLGLNMFVALHMRIEGNKVITAANPSGSPDPKPTLPVTMPLTAPETQVREIGCAKGFVHKIQLKPHVATFLVHMEWRLLLLRRLSHSPRGHSTLFTVLH